jgi:hypothetical protein
MRLTERNFTTGVSINDLIHIVNTGDTTQSPQGSSYKASFEQVLNDLNIKKDIDAIGGPINEQVIVQNSGVETIIYSFKIPANFWKVGTLFLPPYIGFQFQVLPENTSGGVSCIDFNYPGNPNNFPIVGYSGQTLTFSQVSTTGSGNGVQLDVTFDSFGFLINYNVLDEGFGYVTNDIITTDDLGFGSLSFLAGCIVTPNTIYTFYLGTTENDISNPPIYQDTISDGNYFASSLFFNGLTNVSGFGVGSATKITDNTTIVYTTLEYNPIYNMDQLQLNTTTIPDITQDIWVTITAETQVNNLPIDLIWVGTTNNPSVFYSQ